MDKHFSRHQQPINAVKMLGADRVITQGSSTAQSQLQLQAGGKVPSRAQAVHRLLLALAS